MKNIPLNMIFRPMLLQVEDKNYGWDLEACKNNICYKLEVKGLSGDRVSIELSENEYKKCKLI